MLELADGDGAPRRRYELKDDTGFDEVPKKYRKFYRRWEGPGDALAPNEVSSLVRAPRVGYLRAELD